MEPDILVRLRKWASYRTGEQPPMPNNGNWGAVLNADLNEAISEIEDLRSIVEQQANTIRRLEVLHKARDRVPDRDFATIRQDLKTA